MAVSDLVRPFDRFSRIFVDPGRGALRRLQRQAQRTPEDVEVLRRLCLALDRHGRRDEAVARVHHFLQRTGTRELDGAGAILRDLRAFDMAELVYAQLVQQNPGRAAPLLWLGVVHAQQGDAERAQAELEKAVELEPSNPETWYRLGTFHLRRRAMDPAEMHLRRALEVDASFARAHTNLGFLLDLRGERAAAIREFQRALQLAPDVPQNCFNLGALWAEAGCLDQALEQFHAGVALDPRHAEGFYNLGAVYFEQRRYDDAIASFQRALQLHPEHPDASFTVGLCWLRKGVYARALKHLEQVAAGEAPGLRLLVAMGQCYNGLDRPREAVRVLSKVIAQAPDHARAHHLLAICFDKLGERDRADEAYRKSDLLVTRSRQRRAAARVGIA